MMKLVACCYPSSFGYHKAEGDKALLNFPAAILRPRIALRYLQAFGSFEIVRPQIFHEVKLYQRSSGLCFPDDQVKRFVT
jgi:hypothetical protein